MNSECGAPNLNDVSGRARARMRFYFLCQSRGRVIVTDKIVEASEEVLSASRTMGKPVAEMASAYGYGQLALSAGGYLVVPVFNWTSHEVVLLAGIWCRMMDRVKPAIVMLMRAESRESLDDLRSAFGNFGDCVYYV